MKQLAGVSTRAPLGSDKKETKDQTARLIKEMDGLQELLYAEGKHSVLVILQGMDASGKDGAIKKVFGHLNPQGIQVKSFKVPTEEEKNHDFLWRIHQHSPEKGMIQIFNRSQYEEVLITRVHGLCDDATAKKRFAAINHFEELLVKHNRTTIFKFYLHITQEEQQERFKERKEDPPKHWKYSKKDLAEAKLWDRYMEAYEDVFENCQVVPWTIVPSDQNWYKEYLIAETVTRGLRELNMKLPGLKENP